MGVAHEQADAVAAMADADYLALLQQRFGSRPGRFTRLGKRVAYPIRRLLATPLVAPRADLIGNAAQTIHPTGAPRFHLGLRDVLCLPELLVDGGGRVSSSRHAEILAGHRAAQASPCGG